MYIVGKVLRPRGLKGEVKVEIITSFPGHFQNLKTLFAKNETEWKAYSISEASLSNRHVYLKFAEIVSLEQAEKLRGKELFIEHDQLTDLSEDEYYVHDLIGMQVVTEKGKKLGELLDVETYTGNDVYVIKNSSGKEFLIPAIQDIIKNVDVENKILTIHLMDGLLD